jgi:hypothetical protein
MPYVRFTAKSRSLKPLATLNRHGRIDLSSSVRERFKLQSYQHCVLYYDEKARKIGVELTNDSTEEGAMSLKHTPTGSMISSKRFLDYFDILPARTTIYSVTQAANGLIEIHLRRIHHRSSHISKNNKAATDTGESPVNTTTSRIS